jgi:hypothetical protein
VANQRLRFIVFQDGEWLCAQCVEFDLAAQGRTQPELYRVIDRLICSHIALREKLGLTPFKDLPAAPQKYRDMFNRSKLKLPPILIRPRGSGKGAPAELRVAAPAA